MGVLVERAERVTGSMFDDISIDLVEDRVWWTMLFIRCIFFFSGVLDSGLR